MSRESCNSDDEAVDNDAGENDVDGSDDAEEGNDDGSSASEYTDDSSEDMDSSGRDRGTPSRRGLQRGGRLQIKSPVKRQPASDRSSSGSSSSPAGSCSDAQTWVQDSAHGAVTDAPPCCPGSPEEIMSVDEEGMLRGAFIIHAELPAPLTRSQVMEPMLPSDPAACLRKFRAILLAVGLKCDDVQFQRDFDQLIALTRLDPERPCVTYGVFRGYYISEVRARRGAEQGEAAIARAWRDLHAGTGRRAREGRDFIAAADLRRVLTHECERLTDEEAAELLQECRPDADGRVHFEGYRRMLVGNTA
eukprot:TRINITY_DN1566_c0_g1_i1.p1 TRINITY_DN1566_c0_g1~~TRINITY_DN1566_c0_g1_i1.p1  ORF type:complete len:305 (-),score=91.64 TRINITY_DN1566_c0_g1_i1:744-1658(-)